MNNILCNDLHYHITTFLDFNNIINYSSINKNFNIIIFNDSFFYDLAIKYYSYHFWETAKIRSTVFSKPLNSYKRELIRLEYFQCYLEKYNLKRWTMHDFYCYWNTLEFYL